MKTIGTILFAAALFPIFTNPAWAQPDRPAGQGNTRGMDNRAEATLVPVGGSSVRGKARFVERSDGTTKISIRAWNLQPGKHGIHVHEGSHCSGKAAHGAGGHYDPHESGTHGGPGDPAGEHHAGDLGNIEANWEGYAVFELITDQLRVRQGPLSVQNRTLVIHEGEDNLTDDPPNGGSGARVACGAIRSSRLR